MKLLAPDFSLARPGYFRGDGDAWEVKKQMKDLTHLFLPLCNSTFQLSN